jgi:hypothetical protein
MKVGRGGVTALSADEMGWELVQLRQAIDRLELVFSAKAAAFAATDEYARGSRSLTTCPKGSP